MCRSPVTMLHFNFEESLVQNPRIKPVINEVYHYNFLFSNERKSFWVKIKEIPFYAKRLFSFFTTREGFRFLLFELSHNVILISLVLYILSPLDIIPEAIFGIIGLLDDLIVFGVLIYILIELYYQHMARRNNLMFNNNINRQG